MSNKNNTYSTTNNRSKKIILGGMGTALVVLFIIIVITVSNNNSSSQSGPPNTTPSSPSGSITAEIKNGVQEVTMDVTAAGYNPAKIVVKKGIPVKISTKSTEDAGCVRGIMFPAFNLNEALEIGNDTLEFTPDKTGTFEFMCQMRMSKGVLEVVS